MALSYDEIINVLVKFQELKRKESTQDRISFEYTASPIRKKNVAVEIASTGNGYLFVGYLAEYVNQMDDRGYISIKPLTRDEFHEAVQKVIQSFHQSSKDGISELR